MEWERFNTHGDSPNQAFEVMCNILFEKYCKRTYGEGIHYFTTINGSGGDGGVEAYCVLKSGEVIGVQSKWFRNKIEASQISQIENSFKTAVKTRPNIVRYVVCIPRDLGSIKVVKGGEHSQNNEETRWNTLVYKLKKDYPNIEIELWNETRICSEIQRPESVGSQKYWFDANEIIEDEIILSINKAISSWGNTKYIPEIYSMGYIHEILEKYLGSRELSQKRKDQIDRTINRLEKLQWAYADILNLPVQLKDDDIQNITDDIQTTKEWISIFKKCKDRVSVGETIEDNFRIKEFRLVCNLDHIRDSIHPLNYYSHYHDLEQALQGIYFEISACRRFISNELDNRLILLGNPGTGKTAGIIAEVNDNLRNRRHLPILIHARDFSDGDTWKSILEKTIGLSGKNDEYEIFHILDIAAQNYKKNHKSNENDSDYVPKCIICIDGIDEAPSHKFWQRMIEETKAFNNDFPHVKFVFLSRPYVFESLRKGSDAEIIRELPWDGDAPIKGMFKNYCDYYHIDIAGNDWICDQLKSPLALSIFCEINRGKRIENIEKSSMIITNLFRKKIEQMEGTFQEEGKENTADTYVHQSLLRLSGAFLQKKNIEHRELLKILKSDVDQPVEDILQFLMSEGLLYSYKREGDIFNPTQTFYSWGRQPVLDYLIAEQIWKAIESNNTIDEINFSEEALQMFSILLLERKNKLVNEIDSLQLSDGRIFELICYSLVSVSSDIARDYKDYVKALMRNSVDQFRKIVEKIVCPCSKVKNHPLGGKLLDEFLREFDNAAQRDIWWSVPGYLRCDPNDEWYNCEDIEFSRFERYLDLDSDFMDWPIVYVWKLSSTRNEDRYNARLKLLEWGMNKPESFYELFVYCNDINDPQIIEDIYAVAYSICLIPQVSSEYLKITSDWILEHVFSVTGLQEYRNIIIRYYARGIVEIAISYGLQEKRVQSRITPPYQIGKDAWPDIAKEAIDAERMAGYGPIHYDLSRYVLTDPLESKFFYKSYNIKNYTSEAKKVLEYYSKQAGRKSITISGLIVSLAYQYILNMGWNKKDFWEYGADKVSGVDSAIIKQYHYSTHGSQSSVMSVSEKYVWCALHMIEAFFADLMPVHNDEDTIEFINNYCDLENFVNVYQDYINLREQYSEKKDWLHQNQLCNIAGIKFENKEKSIKEWINEEHLPEFKKWILENSGKTLLYSQSNLNNEKLGIQEDVWISSGYVNKNVFEVFLAALDDYCEDRYHLFDVVRFVASQRTKGFCTPQEACVVPSREEIGSCIHIGDVEVIATVAESIAAHHENIEKILYMPSEITRDFLNIIYGDGYRYYDKDGKVICEYLEVGDEFNDKQEALLVDADLFEKNITQAGYQAFWIYGELREASRKAYERYGNDINDRFERTFVVWFEGDECKYKELLTIEPPETNIKCIEDMISLYLSDEEE